MYYYFLWTHWFKEIFQSFTNKIQQVLANQWIIQNIILPSHKVSGFVISYKILFTILETKYYASYCNITYTQKKHQYVLDQLHWPNWKYQPGAVRCKMQPWSTALIVNVGISYSINKTYISTSQEMIILSLDKICTCGTSSPLGRQLLKYRLNI